MHLAVNLEGLGVSGASLSECVVQRLERGSRGLEPFNGVGVRDLLGPRGIPPFLLKDTPLLGG